MTNAEARFNNSLHPRKPTGSLCGMRSSGAAGVRVSRGGRLGLSVLTSLLVFVDVENY